MTRISDMRSDFKGQRSRL